MVINMNERIRILGFLTIGLLLLFIYSNVITVKPKTLTTDSGFDSSWDSGSSSSSSSSSSSDIGSGTSTDGEPLVDEELKVFHKYFDKGFNIDSYLNYFY